MGEKLTMKHGGTPEMTATIFVAGGTGIATRSDLNVRYDAREDAKSRALGRARGMAAFLKFVGEAVDLSLEKPPELPIRVKSEPVKVESAAIRGLNDAIIKRVAKRFDIPPPGTITPTTPLRLEVAAGLAYPDGSMNAAGLRRSGVTIERTNGKDYTTLADIEEMRESCRVKPTAHGFTSRNVQVASRSGSSETPESPSKARAALKASLQRPRVPSRGISSKNTIPATSGEVIPMKSK